MDGVREIQSPGRQDFDPGPLGYHDQLYRASSAGGGAHRAIRGHRRPRSGHGRNRLRLWYFRRIRPGRAGYRVLEAAIPGSRGTDRLQPAVALAMNAPLGSKAAVSIPFRFYDNRQKYLAFITTCNEKSAIARRAAHEMTLLRPTPPALRIFDAGMGDGTVLTRVMRSTHRLFPTVPLFVVAKEISLEDVRLGLEKLPDRLFEHPATVFVVTNLNYAEAPRLMPRDAQAAAALNWQEVRLTGTTAHEYAEQIEELGSILDSGWQTTPNPKSGNPKV